MELEGIMLSEQSPSQKATYHSTFLRWQNYRDGEQIRGCQGSEMVEEGERDFKGSRREIFAGWNSSAAQLWSQVVMWIDRW